MLADREPLAIRAESHRAEDDICRTEDLFSLLNFPNLKRVAAWDVETGAEIVAVGT
jgi:hypothetical protein